MFINYLETFNVNPWGVEPQSKEPESFILSIELRVQRGAFVEKRGKITAFFVTLQHPHGNLGDLALVARRGQAICIDT